jgi:hypothetical protein
MVFFADGIEYFRHNKKGNEKGTYWSFDNPLTFIVNNAVGGN